MDALRRTGQRCSVGLSAMERNEKNATLAPDAYCAPALRSCIAELAATQPARGAR